MIESMLTRYLGEAMKRAKYKTLENSAFYGRIPGLPGVWADERTLKECRKVLQEVLEEWLVLKIRDGDPFLESAGLACLQGLPEVWLTRSRDGN